jgi:hypothetical protein
MNAPEAGSVGCGALSRLEWRGLESIKPVPGPMAPIATPPCQPAGRFRPGFAVVVASDKLFYWLFQNQHDRICQMSIRLMACVNLVDR